MEYAVGFARPDRWQHAAGVDAAFPWHAVETNRPPTELDGETGVAVCGAAVQIWGFQNWSRVGAGRTACPRCRELASTNIVAPLEPAPAPAPPEPRDRRLRVVSGGR